MGGKMKCPKHGCAMTETITDDVFCGVCVRAKYRATLEKLVDVMQRCDAEKAQERQTTDEEWDAALAAACALLDGKLRA